MRLFEPTRVVNPIKPAYDRLYQYASSPVNRAECYAELAISSLAVNETISSTHCAYPQRNGQAELVWVADYIAKTTQRQSSIPVLTEIDIE